eukprot:GHVR01128456.1.p1 GENE.GHVR01128456.1~~GHVR01128456.1.p1  ORF type:complete len:183 (+),score=24.47 GHVR01128456.1:310-858(+)
MADKLFSEDFAKCAVISCLPLHAAENASTSPEDNVLILDNGCVLHGDRKWAKRLQVAIHANDYWVMKYLKMRRVNMNDIQWGTEDDEHTEDAPNDNVFNHQIYMDRDMEMGFPGGPVNIDDFECGEENALRDKLTEGVCYNKTIHYDELSHRNERVHYDELSLLYSRRELDCHPLNNKSPLE